jgi:hypothetical protein
LIEDLWADDYEGETVYFWYDSSSNTVVQNEIVPGLCASLFDYKEEAIHFMEEYAEDYSDDQIGHYELYEAELEPMGSLDDILS